MSESLVYLGREEPWNNPFPKKPNPSSRAGLHDQQSGNVGCNKVKQDIARRGVIAVSIGRDDRLSRHPDGRNNDHETPEEGSECALDECFKSRRGGAIPM